MVLNGGSPRLKNTVVVGGGATGCELALHLAEKGSTVTLVEMLPKIGHDIEAMTRKIMIRRLNALKVRILTDTKVSRLETNGIRIIDKNGRKRFLETNSVVPAIGFEKDDRLYMQIKSLGVEVYQIGDCVEPRNAKSAIYESAVLGRRI